MTAVNNVQTDDSDILVDMMLSSLLALIYTNDLFTAYVFVEINTIAACGLTMQKNIAIPASSTPARISFPQGAGKCPIIKI